MKDTNQTIRLPLGPGASVEMAVLYEDDATLALDKPSGLMIAPDTYDTEKPNLMSAVRRALDTQAPWVAARHLSYLANAHRIDADTSGVVLLTKTREALRDLAQQFNDRTVGKVYLALVEGDPRRDEFTVEMRLGPHPARPWVQVERRHGGKWTLTRFRVLERFRFPFIRGAERPAFGACSLVRCEPETGRTHQIRAHLQHAEHSIVADAVYGQGAAGALLLSAFKPGYKPHSKEPERPLMGRLALHAERLTFKQPTTGKPIEVVAPLPKDFAVSLKYLRKFATYKTQAVITETP